MLKSGTTNTQAINRQSRCNRQTRPVSRGGVDHRPVERGWGTETACTGSSLTLLGAQPLLCSTRPGGRSGDRPRQDSWRNTPECDRRQSGDGSVSALP